MKEISKINKTQIGAIIADTCHSYGNELADCIFTCQDDNVMRKYFPDKEVLTDQDIGKVFTSLFNKFVSATEELNSLSKRDVVHRSEIEGFLKNIRDTYYEYDNFAITKFDADYPRCNQCKEIILKPSKTLKSICEKCDSKVYSFIIEKCGMESVKDILSESDIDLDLSLEEIIEKVLKNKKICYSLVDRYNKFLKEDKF